MKVGIRVPSYSWQGMTVAEVAGLRGYAERAEDLGFDSLWVIEHLLVAPPIYRVSWLDPLEVLAFLAACTSRVQLGSGIIVLPLRHPVMLAKQIASLWALAQGRLILGVGPGWYRPEFEAVGVNPAERGARTDECLEALRLLLTQPNVSFEGRFFRFLDVSIDPLLPAPPPIWVAGGSSTDPSSGEPVIPVPVLDRIVHSDGWLSGSSGRPDEQMKRDWQRVQAAARALGRDPRGIVFGHTQFLHIVESDDRERVVADQMVAFRRVMGDRSAEKLAADYLFGTTDDMLRRLRELAEIGLEHIVLTPLTSDPRQLDLIAERLLPHVR